VQVYAAMLLGFLVEGQLSLRLAAAKLLPGGTLEAVTGAIERCLHFYINAGAITEHNERSLRQLLTSLSEDA
jgi:hypothetical protein